MPPKDKGKAAAGSSSGSARITLTHKGRKFQLNTDDLGPADDLACRRETGYPVGRFLEDFGSDSLTVVLWMARRKSGEPNLAYAEVLKQFPSYKSLEDVEAEMETDGDEDNDPLDGDD